MRNVCWIVAVMSLAGCAQKPVAAPPPQPGAPQAANVPAPQPLDNALLWMRTSAEYQAVCRQVFLQATQALLLDTAVSGAACDKPRAVIMDLDETVIDNSLFSIWTAAHPPANFGKAWEYWVSNYDSEARLVPGAHDFIHAAWAKGFEVIFISNRPESVRPQTIATLNRLIGPPKSGYDEFNMMLYAGGPTGKEPRRAVAAQHFCIVALIGDNLADMAEQYEARRAPNYQARTGHVTEVDEAMWGVRWFALPNSVYGDWKNALRPADLDAIRALAPPAMPAP